MILRYLSRVFYMHILAIACVVMGLFFFLDYLSEAKSIENQYGHILIAWNVLLRAPYYLYEFFPIIVLMAGILSMHKLAQGAEFSVLRTHGLTPLHLLRHLFVMTLPLMIMVFLIGQYLIPISDQWSQDIKNKALRRHQVMDMWLKNNADEGKQFIRIADASQIKTNTLKNVYIYQFNALDSAQMKDVFFANLVVLKNDGFDMYEVTHIDFKKPQQAEKKYYPFLHKNIKISIDNIKNSDKKNYNAMSIQQLKSQINYLKSNQQDWHSYAFQLLKRFTYPFLLLCMMCIAMKFAYQHHRFNQHHGRVLRTILFGIGLYLLYTIILQWADLNNHSPQQTFLLLGIAYMLYIIIAIRKICMRG